MGNRLEGARAGERSCLGTGWGRGGDAAHARDQARLPPSGRGVRLLEAALRVSAGVRTVSCSRHSPSPRRVLDTTQPRPLGVLRSGRLAALEPPGCLQGACAQARPPLPSPPCSRRCGSGTSAPVAHLRPPRGATPTPGGACATLPPRTARSSPLRGVQSPPTEKPPPRALPVWLPGPERGHRAGDSVSAHTLLHVGARRVWRPVKRRRKTQPGDGWGGRRAPRCRHTVRGRRQVRGRAGSSLITRHVRGAAGRLCAWSPGGQPPGHLGRRQMSPASLSLRYNSALPWSWLGKGPLSPGPAPRGLSVSCPARCFSTAASWGGERKWGSAQHTSGPACAAWRPRPLPVKAGAAPAGAHPTQEARWW